MKRTFTTAAISIAVAASGKTPRNQSGRQFRQGNSSFGGTMKRTFAAAALSLATVASANAATKPPTVWQGDLFISSLAGSCPSGKFNVGDTVQAIYAPGGLPGNITVDQLAVFSIKLGATQFQPTVGATLNGATSGTGWWIDTGGSAGQAVDFRGSIAISPPNVSSTTQTVGISMTPQFGADCTVTFQGVLALRPGKLAN